MRSSQCRVRGPSVRKITLRLPVRVPGGLQPRRSRDSRGWQEDLVEADEAVLEARVHLDIAAKRLHVALQEREVILLAALRP